MVYRVALFLKVGVNKFKDFRYNKIQINYLIKLDQSYGSNLLFFFKIIKIPSYFKHNKKSEWTILYIIHFICRLYIWVWNQLITHNCVVLADTTATLYIYNIHSKQKYIILTMVFWCKNFYFFGGQISHTQIKKDTDLFWKLPII